MITSHHIADLKTHLTQLKNKGLKIGFVPTMGALHAGHISLVDRAKKDCDTVVVSIFVNPTQFNNASDLASYPRQEEKDIQTLKENGCDIVFLPSAEEIYPPGYDSITIDLDPIENTMEGAHRPGHFNGVVNVVSRLFKIIGPHIAYFGRKDFQQVAVIKEMVKQLQFDIKIATVETKRDPNGLAMSSRNLRLSEQQKEEATILSQVLKKGKSWANTYSPYQTREKMKTYLSESSLELEYLQIVHPEDLTDLNQYWVEGATACIAAFCGDVRLIDNMELVEYT
ncbi:pantoate--beta-alanine ligase [Brumimicrobium salinarum]|uniref:pantoate--beta-alanine ligase n=1 Tax=Brumimicrobium salinarum TaxID=2058658 RepID=UPI00196AF912|nr:pantoate--beta-alanine ligase [Brumimicrobium salinarum]